MLGEKISRFDIGFVILSFLSICIVTYGFTYKSEDIKKIDNKLVKED